MSHATRARLSQPGQSAQPIRFSESAGVLPRVEIFEAGVHKGKVYTTADLDDMVAAFQRYSKPRSGKQVAPVAVPAVLGHDEAAEQLLLQQTGLPAAAWTEDVWRDGDKLVARLSDVPPEVMRLIEGRRYTRVSAEIYDRHPAGVPTAGEPHKMLRRIAFLGGEIPQVKTLADIPVPHSERAGIPAGVLRDNPGARLHPVHLRAVRVIPRHDAGSFLVFSEVVAMNKDELLSQLQKMGMDTEALQLCDERALAEMVRALSDKQAANAQGVQPATDTNSADTMPTAPADQPADGTSATEPDVTASPTIEKQGDLTITHKDDDDDPQSPPEGAPPEKMAAYHTAMAKKFSGMCGSSKYSEKADPRFREIEERLARVDRMTREREKAERRSSVTSRLNALVSAGKVLPAERGMLDDALLAVPADAVAKFSDGGTVVEEPVLERLLKALESRPVLVRFSERIPATPQKSSGSASEDAEVAKLEEHFEQFSEEFEKVNLTREQLLEGFKLERKSNRKLTADEYLNR